MKELFKIVGLWSAPHDGEVEEFEKHYESTHVPLAAAVPGLRKITLTRAEGGFAGAAFYRIAEMYFDSPESMAASAESPQWHAMHEDGQHLINRFGVTMQALAGWEH